METNMLTALDGPVTLTREGVTYQFPIWKTKELLPVIARLRDAKIKLLRERLAEFKVPAPQVAYTIWQEETKPVNPYEAHVHFMNAEGVDECLTASLIRGGTAKEAAQSLVDSLRFEDKAELALRVGGIVDATPAKPNAVLSKKSNEGLGFGDQGQTVPEQKPGLGDAVPTTAA